MAEKHTPQISDLQPDEHRQLAEHDSRHLAQVAVGLGSQLAPDAAERLIEAGLIRRPPHRLDGAPELELTAQGLAHIRSSDQ